MLDPVEFGKSMGVLIRDAVSPLQKTIGLLQSRINELEAREPLRGEPGAKGDPGEPGRKGDPGKDAVISDEQVSRAVFDYLRANPPAQGLKGDPGKDAPKVTEEELGTIVTRYLRDNPAPRGEPGAKGDPGEPGKKGDPGKDADPISLKEVVSELLESDEINSLVELRVKESVATIPPPKDGNPGKDAEPVSEKQISRAVDDYLRVNPVPAGVKGDPGVDGIGLAGAMIDRDGTLIITTTKGEAVRLGKVVGNDGSDGLGFDDMEGAYNGERGITLKFTRGEKVKEFNFHLPVIIDRGYWREGTKAKQGDAVTHDGTLWIALRDTAVKPCVENSDDWRIGARKGRDGRPGKNGLDAHAAVKLESADA